MSLNCLLVFMCLLVLTLAEGKFKCQDRLKLCMSLCCDKNLLYNFKLQQCVSAKDMNVTWNKQLELGHKFFKTVNLLTEFDFEERTPCRSAKNYTNFDYDILSLDYVFGNFCFTPYYVDERKAYVLLPVVTNCNKTEELLNAQEISVNASKKLHITIVFAMIITTMVFAVLTMFIYGSIKELRQTIQTKLFISYGASLVLPLFIVMVIIYEIFYPFLRPKDVVILDHITLYFGIASIIWSNVICYEMKRNARLMNHRHDLRAIWIRFFWYSLFVWCLSLALLLLNSFTVNRDPIYTDAFMVIFLSLNLIVFFLLTFQILKSNVQAAKLQCGNYNIIKNFRIVLRLAAMMGLSQITYYVAFAIGDNIDSVSGTKLIYIMGGVYMADAILVFLLFVLKRNVLNILKARYGCCCLIHNNNSVSGPTSSPSI